MSPIDISLSCTVRVYLTSQDNPMQGPSRGRHVYVVGLLQGWGCSIGNIVRRLLKQHDWSQTCELQFVLQTAVEKRS